MNSDKNAPRLIGIAFLVQAIASVTAGTILPGVLNVSDNIVATMTHIANNASQIKIGIMVELITVIALIVLSALLFVVLRNQNIKIALVALGLRITEVALLASSRIVTFALLHTSQASVTAGHPAYLQVLGNLAYETQEFAYSMNMVFFTLGGTLFYYLLLKSDYVPRVLSLCGLIVAPLAFLGTVGELFGISVPLIVFIPNLPFELAIGLWLLVKGIKDTDDA